MNNLFSRKYITVAVLATVFIFNLLFGIYHLSRSAVVDEPLWTLDRIPRFWEKLQEGRWDRTDISDKPGITLAILSGTALNFVDPKDFQETRHNGEISYPQGKDLERFNFFMRLPVLLFNALSLFLIYFLLEKILGNLRGLLAIVFIGLSPLLLGISKIVNPDSLLWVFAFCSLLSYFAYLKEEKAVYLYLTGIFLGGALLTKYVANIFYIFFFGLILTDYVVRREKYHPLGVSHYLKKRLRDYATLTALSLLIYFIFLPAAWVDPRELLEATVFSQAFEKVWPVFAGIVVLAVADTYLLKNKLFSPVLEKLSENRQKIVLGTIIVFAVSAVFCAANTYLGMKWYDFETILASPKSSYLETGFLGMFFSGFYPAIFGIAPLALLAIIFYFFKVFGNVKKEKKISFESAVFFYSLLLAILYYLASAASQIGATVRYQIVLYPIFFMLAAMGLRAFFETEKTKKYLSRPILLLVVIVFSLWSLNSIRPFYFSYASDLLPKKYVLNLKDMGDGSYEAAQYLNGLPDASLKGIWTDKKGVCAFFSGRCYIGAELNKSDLEKIDYFVVSSGRESRTTSMNKNRLITQETELKIYPLYTSDDHDFKLEIGGRSGNFVKVFSSSKIAKIE